MSEITLWNMLRAQQIDESTYSKMITEMREKELKNSKNYPKYSDGATKPNTKGFNASTMTMKRKGSF